MHRRSIRARRPPVWGQGSNLRVGGGLRLCSVVRWECQTMVGDRSAQRSCVLLRQGQRNNDEFEIVIQGRVVGSQWALFRASGQVTLRHLRKEIVSARVASHTLRHRDQ